MSNIRHMTKEIKDPLIPFLYEDTLHFVEETLDAGIGEKNYETGKEYWSQDITGLKEKELVLKQYRERLENSERHHELVYLSSSSICILPYGEGTNFKITF